MDREPSITSSDAGEEKFGLLGAVSSWDDSSCRDAQDTRGSSPALLRIARCAAEDSLEHLTSTSWRAVLSKVCIFFLPSLFQGHAAREAIRPAALSPTAYLDGMRGLAALNVFLCHFSYQGYFIHKGFGADEDNYHFFRLPFVRLIYQGPPAVCIFFVISGYALSYRAIKLARGGDTAAFGANLSSLVFRRFLRLYLPTIISTLMICSLLQMGAYELTRDVATSQSILRNVKEIHMLPEPNLYLQLRYWGREIFKTFAFFNWDPYGGRTKIDVHLWTIPVEFRCSLYLFLTLIGTARLQTRFRFLIVAGMTWLFFSKQRWEMCLFLCGMLLAEKDHILGLHNKPTLPCTLEIRGHLPSRRTWVNVLLALPWLAGLYLMGQPDVTTEKSPGWVWLDSLLPAWWTFEQYRIWQSVGAVLFILGVSHSPMWQRFYNSFPIQYLGKISYALYLMHGPAMHCLGYHWERLAYGVTGTEGRWYDVGFVISAILCIPTVFWCADVFWRAVDIPSVKFARWMEQKCLAKP